MFSTGVLMTKPEKIIPHNQKFILIIKATLSYFTFLVVDKLFPPEVNKKSVVTFFGKYSSIEQPMLEQPEICVATFFEKSYSI